MEIPERTLERMALRRCTPSSPRPTIRHIYLVGGSLTDGRKEGERFLQLARFVKKENRYGIPVSLGSGAMPGRPDRAVPSREAGGLRVLQPRDVVGAAVREDLPGQEPLCRLPALDRVARDRRARLGSRPRVFGDGGWHRARARSTASNGRRPHASRSKAPRTCAVAASSRSIRSCGRRAASDRPDYHARIRSYFETLNLGYRDIRQRHGLHVSPGFMCHRCAYMQLECDIDRAARQHAVNRTADAAIAWPDRPADAPRTGTASRCSRPTALQLVRPAGRAVRRPPSRWRARSVSTRA